MLDATSATERVESARFGRVFASSSARTFSLEGSNFRRKRTGKRRRRHERTIWPNAFLTAWLKDAKMMNKEVGALIIRPTLILICLSLSLSLAAAPWHSPQAPVAHRRGCFRARHLLLDCNYCVSPRRRQTSGGGGKPLVCAVIYRAKCRTSA